MKKWFGIDNDQLKLCLLYLAWLFILLLTINMMACSGGWEVCGYELDKI